MTTKYEELLELQEKTHSAFEMAVLRVGRGVKQRFAEYLGCADECITVRFGDPEAKKGLIRCDFSVDVELSSLNGKDTLEIHGCHFELGRFNGNEKILLKCIRGPATLPADLDEPEAIARLMDMWFLNLKTGFLK